MTTAEKQSSKSIGSVIIKWSNYTTSIPYKTFDEAKKTIDYFQLNAKSFGIQTIALCINKQGQNNDVTQCRTLGADVSHDAAKRQGSANMAAAKNG